MTKNGQYLGSLIRIRGARQNNLQNIDLEIKPGTWTVITGPSGSGKSSLAFDTLYAEGQRRYVETFSPYARQFLDRCDRPLVEKIDGVPPAIAIDQTNTVRTSRSTVGTMTELNDHLKLLFEREAQLFCRECARPVRDMTAAQIWEDVRKRAEQAHDPRLIFTFDVVVPQKIEKKTALQALAAQGYTKIQEERPTVDGVILSVVTDRFRASKVNDSRAIDAIETALKQGRGEMAGRLTVRAVDENGLETPWPYAKGRVCPHCNISYTAPSSARFSFNSAVGACEVCRGFGRVIGIDLGLIIPDETKSISEGCVKPWAGTGVNHECYNDMMKYAKRDSIRVNVPFKDLTTAEKKWIVEGEPRWSEKWTRQWYGIRHYFEWLETKAYKMHVRVMLSRYRSYTTCPACLGARLKPEGLLWRVGSKQAAKAALGCRRRFVPEFQKSISEKIEELPGLTIHDLMLLPIKQLVTFFDCVDKEITDEPGRLVLAQIRTRLKYLVDVGVGYLTLDRQSRTLSGGEVQRVSLTTALGTNLVDTLFVLDEPSVGLHPKDMDRVNALLGKLRDAGNTLVVVEHDPQVMLAGDRILDMGPGAGEKGGRIVFDGNSKDLRFADTLTGLYLGGRLRVNANLSTVHPENFRQWLTINGANLHNLKNISVSFPLGAMTTVTGVSGSGKSTLVVDTLVPALLRFLGQSASATNFSSMQGHELIRGVHYVDQSSIGKTTRSNPALYMGAFTGIRTLFSQTAKARNRGYGPGVFSFNSGNGRCPTCNGAGFERVEMQFLSDVFLRCPDCDGRRYRPEVLEVTINLDGKGEKSIADILDMTVNEAISYFSAVYDIARALTPLKEVGLDYVKLGQPVTTLSGGEAQRLKLAEILSLAKKTVSLKGQLYVFDEPTTGLHFDDIAKFLSALRRLIRYGATVVLVEHNLDVINASDWLIDLGPEGGDEGGFVVDTGTPGQLVSREISYTGKALKAYRECLDDPEKTMIGLFSEKKTRRSPSHGRSLQSVWKKASAFDLGIFGAREHNLKNIDVVIPKKKFSVVTGVSGSGKSTLAFGIVFSEGQRRYLESLNAYARSMVQPGIKADVDEVVGIAPTVAIEQRTSRGGRKSTVSTLTEIQHFLRLLYVKLGTQYCPVCQIPVTEQSIDAIFANILKTYRDQRITVAAPLVVARKGIYTEQAKWAQSHEIEALYVDGHWVNPKKFPSLSRYNEHTIEAPMDTLTVNPSHEIELRKAIQAALFNGHGVLTVLSGNKAFQADAALTVGAERSYSTKRACPQCARSFPQPDPRLFSYNSKLGWCPTCFGTGVVMKGFDADQTGEETAWLDTEEETIVCPTCLGKRLNEIAQNIRFLDKSICDITQLSVADCIDWFKNIRLAGRQKALGEDAVKEILSRLTFLKEVGLDYLNLDRDAPSLSGGEAQRIRLASQLGSNLQGVCYVLDEPTIGLHARDNSRLISSLINLKEKGNTVVVVEHDEETIRRADHIIDIGPEAGSRGGRLMIEGSLNEILKHKESLTARFLRHPLVHCGKSRREVNGKTNKLLLSNINKHNLNNLTVEIPLNRLVVLTGVSGSGKSTLARDVLLKTLKNAIGTKDEGFECVGAESISGFQTITRVLEVDQTPIGKTPRSCPATYVGFFNQIRDLFSYTDDAKAHGWGPSRFSFNTAEGRCPICEGQGEITVEMNFLPDVKIPCDACKGLRFDEETLTVRWHDHSIGEILNLSVDEALPVFESNAKIHAQLMLLRDVGLGYLKLGQPSSTLSGGEAQRIKLVTELAKADTTDVRVLRKAQKTFYILDEPTVGLHMADVEKLIRVLHRLVDAGNSVLIVEHNLDVIAEADAIIDLGPEGGPAGGKIVGLGNPEEISRLETPTGKALKNFLQLHSRSEKESHV